MNDLFKTFENWLRNLMREISQQQTAAMLERIEKLEEANRVAALGEKPDSIELSDLEDRIGLIEREAEGFKERVDDTLRSLKSKSDELEERLDSIDVDGDIEHWVDCNLDDRVREEVRDAIGDLSFEVTVR